MLLKDHLEKRYIKPSFLCIDTDLNPSTLSLIISHKIKCSEINAKRLVKVLKSLKPPFEHTDEEIRNIDEIRPHNLI